MAAKNKHKFAQQLLATDLTAAKKQLRQIQRQRRKNMPEKKKRYLEQEITQRFLESAAYQDCTQLFCFVSLPQELDTTAILRQALQDQKIVCVPRCLAAHQMQFYRLDPSMSLSEQLCVGTYGVREPKLFLCEATPQTSKKEICLVPGLAFDRKGGRLGYGGGYYDRFLKHYPQLLKIGYTASCFVLDTVPTESSDQLLDGIVTEYLLEVWHGQ